MSEYHSKPCTAFEGTRRLLCGPLIEVALAVKTATERGAAAPILTFDDATGHVIDFDLRGTKADIVERLTRLSPKNIDPSSSPRAASSTASKKSGESRGRGRPKLGVVGREVTLLPKQWTWLAAQPGGASVTLRKLVNEAQRTGGAAQKMRAAQERAYRFMSAMAGDLPGFEEATRALFSGDRARFDQHVAGWPTDVRTYATGLAFGAATDGPPVKTTQDT
ncbi:DUF2239 family protein [Varunaivibrio sulfuroxidans]|nr:DUF2239 family protein [Varunaivibrio sulfuroxidans]WES30716.1 DUF2239 family protein [Varunaivibrio sulfuroxidans]